MSELEKFEVWFDQQRRDHWNSLYPREPFRELWGTGERNAMYRAWMARATLETPVRQVHSKSEHKRLTALGVECVVAPAETKGDAT
jgi:hypothetical protein